MNLIFFYFSLNIFSYFFLSFLFYITESILDNFFVYIHFFTLLGSIWLNKFPHMRQLSCLFNYSSMIDVGNIWQLLLRNIIIILCVLFCLFFGTKAYGESSWTRYFSNQGTRFIVQLWGKMANGVYNKVLFHTSDPATWWKKN